MPNNYQIAYNFNGALMFAWITANKVGEAYNKLRRGLKGMAKAMQVVAVEPFDQEYYDNN